MKRSICVCALGLIACPATAETAQFDLICSGEKTITTFDAEEVEPYTTHLRVDLADERWCEDECKAIHDIKSVQPTQITFEEKADDGIDENSFTLHFVNRQTGVHHVSTGARYRRFPRLTVTIDWRGKCTLEDFSGFPTFDTQF